MDAVTLWAALFRDLNLGQRRTSSPTSAQLVAALGTGGASEVENVRSNGTVLFSAADGRAALDAALAELAAVTGYAGEALLRTTGEVAEIVATADPDLPGGEVSFFDADGIPQFDLPWIEPRRGALTLVVLTPRFAVTSWSHPSAGSNATRVLTDLLGVPVTSRAIGTVRLLHDRLEAAG